METQQPLVCPSHTTQYIVAVIIGIIVGVGTSFVYFKQAPASTVGNSYQDGYDAAKKRVLESPMGAMFRTPDDVHAISGTVTAISDNRITIHVQSANIFDENPALPERIIIITSNTKISKLSPVDPKVFQSEMEAFIKGMQSAKPSSQLAPPSMTISEAATIADIAVGNTLDITALEDIKTAKEFSPSQIYVQAGGAGQNLTPLVPIIK